MKSNSNKLWGEFWVHSPRWIYINQSSYYYHFSIFGLSGSCCCCWSYQPSPPPWVLFSLTMFHLSAPSISFWNGQPGDLFQDVEEKLPNQARLLLLILQVSASLSLAFFSFRTRSMYYVSRVHLVRPESVFVMPQTVFFLTIVLPRLRFDKVCSRLKKKTIAAWKFDEVIVVKIGGVEIHLKSCIILKNCIQTAD